MWSSLIRTVFSTMPSLSPAIRSRKNRSHSLSENVMPFSASSWVRRLAIRVRFAGERQVLVGLLLEEVDERPLEVGLGLVAGLRPRLGDELRNDCALRADRDRLVARRRRFGHAASSNVNNRSR